MRWPEGPSHLVCFVLFFGGVFFFLLLKRPKPVSPLKNNFCLLAECLPCFLLSLSSSIPVDLLSSVFLIFCFSLLYFWFFLSFLIVLLSLFVVFFLPSCFLEQS